MKFCVFLGEGVYLETKESRSVWLKKEVPWTAPPTMGSLVFFGNDASPITLRVDNVNWHTSGDIEVVASIFNAREEYDSLLIKLRNDGFTQWPASP
jgi:hypothetical protein